MRKVQSFGDNRNKGWCVHCGGPNESQDHAPSRVFLDEPYPADLPATPSCLSCNNGFSADEAYLACLIECVLAGTCDPGKITRPKIAKTLEGNPALAVEIDRGRTVTDDGVVFSIDHGRVRNVVLKLARGHAAYELNEPQLDEPVDVRITPITLMNEMDYEAFERDDYQLSVWPEVGSRAMNRLLLVGDDAFVEGWLIVQDNNYRYRTSQDGGLRIRLLIREYLACDVLWD
ncbi:hypothetical protein GCM10008023_06750 [Sphingomonas glacialis]|uniref:HNH endonuclease n=2 Tax=Sphingomonas glacialis TaxID=658225 RepID=A0ABQ3LFP2_9SPHN|nr:hypothetical protein GCM10008023_06750 [Sphingomonas glacialis]